MRRLVALSSVLLLAACTATDTPPVRGLDSRFVVPTLVDVGEAAVGVSHVFTVPLTSEFGSGTLFQVDVLNLDDEVFSWNGDPVTIPSQEGADISFVFEPTAERNSRAILTFLIRGDGDAEGEVEMTVRGRGVSLSVERWPSVLDFGPVLEARSRVREVTVANDSLLPVDIVEADLDGDGFSLEEVMPVTIPAGETVELDIRYSAADALSSEGDLILTLQDGTQLAPVVVRANNCAGGSASLYDNDTDGWTSCAGDCDDTLAGVNPAAGEVADGRDNDCDGQIDEGTAAYDDDGDGFTEQQGDCNDSAFTVNPGRTELLGDGIDNDCDGVADLGSDDIDGDGYSPIAGDCDDRNAAIRPGAVELADGSDNNCNSVVDEGTRLYDDDGDGFCESVQDACSDGSQGGDCADGTGLQSDDVYPGALELPDGIDNDCDGTVDEGTDQGDDDGDGFTEVGGDCNDNNANVHPGRFEVRGNGTDDDCDSSTLD